MFNISGVRGVIFDCDGTLLDTLGAWEWAERELFEMAGPLTEAQQDEIHGAPIEEAAKILHERYGVAASTQAILDHLDAHLMPFYRDEAAALPGAVELVNYLYDQGIPCVVVSSSPQRYLQAGLRRAGLLDKFAGLVSTEDCDIPKSDPAIYGLAAEIADAPLETMWAIDDAPYALRAMGEAGLSTVGVGNGCSPQRAEELQRSATITVNTLEEFLQD